MIWLLDFALLIMLVVTAMAVVISKDLLYAVVLFGIYSLMMAIAYAQLNAPDVALTEAVVGAGFSGLLFFAAISRTKRWEE